MTIKLLISYITTAIVGGFQSQTLVWKRPTHLDGLNHYKSLFRTVCTALTLSQMIKLCLCHPLIPSKGCNGNLHTSVGLGESHRLRTRGFWEPVAVAEIVCVSSCLQGLPSDLPRLVLSNLKKVYYTAARSKRTALHWVRCFVAGAGCRFTYLLPEEFHNGSERKQGQRFPTVHLLHSEVRGSRLGQKSSLFIFIMRY